MSEPSNWREVADRLEAMGRGATSRLAKALRMDPSFLRRKLTGTGEPTIGQAREIMRFLNGAEDEIDGRPPPPNMRLPVYGYAAASSGDRIAFNPGEVIDWMELPAGIAPPGEAFVIQAFGSSMEPRIFDGEALVVVRRMPPVRDRDAVIEFSDGSAVVKTYKGQRNGRVFGEQFNPPQMVDYDATTVRAIHRVWCRL